MPCPYRKPKGDRCTRRRRSGQRLAEGAAPKSVALHPVLPADKCDKCAAGLRVRHSGQGSALTKNHRPATFVLDPVIPCSAKGRRRARRAGCRMASGRQGLRFMWARRQTNGFDAAIRQRSLVLFSVVTAIVLAGATLAHSAFGRSSGRVSASSAQSENSKQQTVPPSSGPATQAPAAESKGDAVPNELPVGTTICAVLTKTVDAKKAKAGDAVAAKATLAVLSHGKVMIADGAKISGHITKASARSFGNPESEVRIVFDHVVLKDGGEMPLALTVQAIGYGGIPLPTEGDPGEHSPYPPPLASQEPSSTRHSSVPQPQPLETPEIPRAGPAEHGTASSTTNPALDVGSKGVVGMPGLTLSEASQAPRGSAVSSSSRNVKLESGSQLILRVIAPE
jgi:biotin carboxyl carrier protein